MPTEPRGQELEAGASGLQAVERALRLLICLAEAPRPQTLSELARLVGCSTSTVHRTITTLAEYHFVEKDPITRRYRLGLQLLHLADARARQMDLAAIARPYMERLSDYTLETVVLYVVHGIEATAIACIESPQELRQTVEIGRPGPLAELGAKNKVLLAYLSSREVATVFEDIPWARVNRTPGQLREELVRIREQGIARSFGERVPEAASIAAPLWDQRGLVGALAIAGPAGRWTAIAMDRAEGALREAAAEISQQLGGRPDWLQAQVAAQRSA
jgi:IclR family KDG regulon transcriptional repressor